jgi:hypothetical protein
MTTVWLALQGALVVSLLLRDGVGWRLLGTFVGFQSMFVLEASGQTPSPLLAGLSVPATHTIVPLTLIVMGMLPLLPVNVPMLALARSARPSRSHLRQRDTLGVSLMTLGMLLLSGSVVLFFLWHVIAAECVRLAQEK